MSQRFRIAVVLMASICLLAMEGSGTGAQTTDEPHENATREARVTVRNASPAQLARLGEAFRAFSDAGLELPDLEIVFFADNDSCGADYGRFVVSEDAWQILMCPNAFDSVYEHELAHAWERANVTDPQRHEFMQVHGYSSWSSKDLPWKERGIEGAAFIIQRGLAGLPLPPVFGAEEKSRMQAYELLTGRPAPVMIEWLEDREVPCLSRPTTLSLTVEDGSGRTCPVTVSRAMAGARRAPSPDARSEFRL